jgi:dTDP-4-amino-4,6-dideoxygalactose transaminase
MCNGTAALEVAIRALGLTGEVIVPAMTFVATAHALQWLGLTPVFADIDPCTHNLDPVAVEAAITPRTSAILGVHLWGRPCPVDALQAAADRHGLALLFDAAHAFGCAYRGCPVGGLGAAETFSFHATKFMHTAEGGAVATRDDGLAERLRLMRNFGFAGYDRVVSVGTNAKMNELQAALGLTMLEELDHIVAANEAVHAAYRAGLAGLPGVRLAPYAAPDRPNYQYVVVEIDQAPGGVCRDDLLAVLWAENVRARRYFYPGCHRMEPYRSQAPWAGVSLPHTEALVERVLCLPAGADVRLEAVEVICGLLRLAVTNGDALAAVLARRRTAEAGAAE